MLINTTKFRPVCHSRHMGSPQLKFMKYFKFQWSDGLLCKATKTPTMYLPLSMK